MAKILFVQPGPIEQIGLMSLSRSLRDKGHTVRLAYGTDNDMYLPIFLCTELDL